MIQPSAQQYFVATVINRPGRSQGCSTNTFVIHCFPHNEGSSPIGYSACGPWVSMSGVQASRPRLDTKLLLLQGNCWRRTGLLHILLDKEKGPGQCLSILTWCRLMFEFCDHLKKELFMLFWITLGHFWCSVVTSVNFSCNLSNFEKNPKNPKKIKTKKIKNSKNLKNQKKI